MKPEDIIRMAKEAGIHGMCTDVICTFQELVNFANLVAATEREDIAQWYAIEGWLLDSDDLSDAIRARGKS